MLRKAQPILIAWSLTVVTPWSASAQVDVVQEARGIAIEVSRALDSTPVAAFGLPPAVAERLQRLRGTGAQGVGVLRAVMEAKDSSAMTRSAAAYTLYLLQPTLVDNCVAVLVGEMPVTSFSRLRFAEPLILAIGAPAVPVLTRSIDEPMIVDLLGALGPAARGAVPALRQRLGQNNVEIAAALAAIGTPEAIEAAKPVLLRVLQEGEEQSSKRSLTALSALGRSAADAAPAIASALSRPSPDVRMYAGIALVDVGDTTRGVEALSRLVSASGPENRYLAISKLRTLGPSAAGATPSLIKALVDSTDHRFDERAEIGVALQRISPESEAVRDALRRASQEGALRAALERRSVTVP